jgi:hypothetical protein
MANPKAAARRLMRSDLEGRSMDWSHTMGAQVTTLPAGMHVSP